MFLDEARLSLSLQHANIVQVFDIGHGDDTYFLVMEYVDGVNLKALIEWRRRINRRVPIAARPLPDDGVLQGAGLRARAPQPRDRRAARHRPPRHLAAQHPHLQERRGQARRLRPGQGDQPDRDHRPGRGEGQVQLPVARGGARRGRRSPRRHLRGRHPALRAAHRQAAVLRRDRLPDRRAGAQREDPADQAARTRRSSPSWRTSSARRWPSARKTATRTRTTSRTRWRSTPTRAA